MRKGLYVIRNRRTWMVVVGLVVWGISFWPGQPCTGKVFARTTQPRVLPYSAMAHGPYSVKGNQILDADGKPYLFHGVARDGLEYDCEGQAGPYTRQSLALMGTPSGKDLDINAGSYWAGNTVRLPLSQNFWLKGGSGDANCTPTRYQALVKRIVDDLASLQLNVILDLHWVGANGQVGKGGAEAAMPDTDSVTFWQQVAKAYKGYPDVLFELYNEPHISPQKAACWLHGCMITNDKARSNDCNGCFKYLTYQAVGMQSLVDGVRHAGAHNLVLVAGTNWGYDLTHLPTYTVQGENVVYDSHPYNYWGKQPADWYAGFGKFAAFYPLMVSEFGSYDCSSNYVEQLLAYLDTLHVGWVAWTWAVAASSGDQVCSIPQLVTDYRGTPSNAMGDAIYQHLHSYVSDSETRWLLTVSDLRTFKHSVH
ncbi:glycoside hydrolase family 5 [Ktedonobacter racemifer DSM 44963]|uniref:cellulase n=1 Tax=Ktedonobacter racemifer DSM 44963 TaxID=485913 RepID=D6TDS5_KTERA|nr:glycoside hydrolase family 5 [Ktedonobacter racemifer DSM 44963]